MTIQERYDKIINLLKAEYPSNSIVLNCLNATSSELTFSFFQEDNKVDKEHILQIYTSKAEFEDDFRPKSPYVLGYKELLPKLRMTDLKYIIFVILQRKLEHLSSLLIMIIPNILVYFIHKIHYLK